MSPDWHLISDNKCYESKNELEVLIDIFDGWHCFQNIPFCFLSQNKMKQRNE